MGQMPYAWQKRWAYEYAHGLRRYADPTDVVAHIEHLLAKGASKRGIADAAGVTPTVITSLTQGQRNIRKTTRAAILAVTPGKVFARAGDDDFVPNIGARRRIRALFTLGHTAATIAEHMDRDDATGAIVHNINTQRGQWISARNHRAVIAAYDALWDKPGTSKRAKGSARHHGYAGPLAWDDDTIDDPDTKPDLGEPEVGRHSRQMFNVEDVEFLLSTADYTRAGLAARLHVTPSAIEQACHRKGRRDLWDRLLRNEHGPQSRWAREGIAS